MLPVMGSPETEKPDGEKLLALKDSILEQWGELPSEHQASMALVLVGQVVEGEYGSWLTEALQTLWVPPAPAKLLPVIPLSKDHLRLTVLTKEEQEQLDDDDLHHMTKQLIEHFISDTFADELEFLARLRLAEKQEKTSKPADG